MKIVVLWTLITLFVLVALCKEDCWNYNAQNGCRSGTQTDQNPDFVYRQFQTPLPGSKEYISKSWQYYGLLQGYSHTVYSADRHSARVYVILRIHPSIQLKIDSGLATIFYVYNDGKPSKWNYTDVDSSSFSDGKILRIHVQIIDNRDMKLLCELYLEEIDFIWNAPAIVPKFNFDPFENGQKGSIVEIFGWPYKDIEQECPMLSRAGYMGLKVFPPQEAVISWDQLQNGEINPWWFMYQPVSYKLQSRWGTRAELRQMIRECRKLGVRVYADAVINHMSGNGNDCFQDHRTGNGGYCAHWSAKNSTADSPYWTQGFAFQNVTNTKQPPGCEFPAVPYGPMDFHCERSLSSWTDPLQLNAGWLDGLADLNTEKDYVRSRIADYLTDLLSIGFSGFRIDAAKHISPDDLAAILFQLKKNLGGTDFPQDFITYLEVIIGGEKDLLMCSYNSYNYGQYFVDAMKKAGLSDSDIFKVKIWDSTYPKEFPICGFWIIPSERLAIENDCHDDQFPGSSSRDMGDKGSVLVKEKNVQKHRQFEKLLFERRDGNWKIRLLLSSYTFNGGAYGPPDGLSDCKLCRGIHCDKQCIHSMPYSKAHDSSVCGYTVYSNTTGLDRKSVV